MITDQITIMETIPTQAFGNVRLEIRGTLEPGETELEAWRQAKEKINAAYQSLYGSKVDYESFAPPPIDYNGTAAPGTEAKTTIQPVNLEDEINSCTSLKVLESYKFIVKTNEQWLQAYTKKHQELSNKL